MTEWIDEPMRRPGQTNIGFKSGVTPGAQRRMLPTIVDNDVRDREREDVRNERDMTRGVEKDLRSLQLGEQDTSMDHAMALDMQRQYEEEAANLCRRLQEENQQRMIHFEQTFNDERVNLHTQVNEMMTALEQSKKALRNPTESRPFRVRDSTERSRSLPDADYDAYSEEETKTSKHGYKRDADLDLADDDDDVFKEQKKSTQRRHSYKEEHCAEEASKKKDSKKPHKKSSHNDEPDADDDDVSSQKGKKKKKVSYRKEDDADSEAEQKPNKQKSNSKKDEESTDSETDEKDAKKSKKKPRKSSKKSDDSSDESDHQRKRGKKDWSKQRRKPSTTLRKFNGEGSIEDFITHFKKTAKFEDWDTDETLHFLSESLVGIAEDAVTEVDNCTTLKQAYQLLKKTFANEAVEERYEAELRNRRRKPGETLTELCHAIKQLMKKAYPAEIGKKRYEKLSRDYFLNSLDDEDICKRVGDQRCETLQEAFMSASSMMSREQAKMMSGRKSSTNAVRTVDDKGLLESTSDTPIAPDYTKVVEMLLEKSAKENKKRDEEVKKREDQMMKQFQAMVATNKEGKPEEKAEDASNVSYYPSYGGRGRGRGGGGQRYDSPRRCFNCNATDGHISKDCPKPKKAET